MWYGWWSWQTGGKEGSTEIWTRIAGFKVQSANHYTIEPLGLATRMGFEPTRAEPNGLAVHRLNHSATSSWKNYASHFAGVKRSCNDVRQLPSHYRWLNFSSTWSCNHFIQLSYSLMQTKMNYAITDIPSATTKTPIHGWRYRNREALWHLTKDTVTCCT